MPRVLYLPEACDGLFVVWEYILEQTTTPTIGDSLIEKIDQTAHIYAAQPEMGELRPDVDNTVRYRAMLSG